MTPRVASESGKWLVGREAPEVQRASLICFPPVGGSASLFSSWRNLLPPDISLFAVQLPGRENRYGEAPIRSCADVVDQLGPVIAARTTGPIVLFGHSMGALLAYNIARWLALHGGGRTPELLVVAGRMAPHLDAKLPAMGSLLDSELIAMLRALGGSPPGILEDPELARLFLPALRADLMVVETYRHTAARPLNVPLLALSGRSDPLCDAASVEAWGRHTARDFAHHSFAGSHFFIREHAAEVVAVIVREIRHYAAR
jgi:surfactin synthase thioesterase subunit